MSHATKGLHDRIGIVFDFELTLGEGSIDVLLRALDVDPIASDASASIHSMTRAGTSARTLQGAHRAVRAARRGGSAGHYADDGRLVFPRRIVTYPGKVRDLLQLAKGLSVDGADAPADVYRDVPIDDWHVPFDRMVYVGDGASDLPAFDLIESRRGIGIGVFGPDASASGWSRDHEVHRGRRVHNLARADYREDAELLRSLCLAVGSIAKRVALRRLGCGE